MTAQLLTAKGYTVDKRTGLGSAALRQAQEAGQVDLYWEYTGTSLITYNKVTDKLDAAQTYDRVKELDVRKGLVWLDPSKANDTYALGHAQGRRGGEGSQNAVRPSRRREGWQGPEIRLQRRVLCPSGRPDAHGKGVWLRLRPREHCANGQRPRLSGATRQTGRRRPCLRDGRAHSCLQLRGAERRQAVLPELRA